MIDIFPAALLDSSILTSVLLGLVVVWVFQETLGWNFTGLVVPGYLASVLVIQPAVAVLIVVEAVVTHLATRALTERVPSWFPWSPLFGRDRFFAILVLSVLVRVSLEGGGLDFIEMQTGLEFQGNLHSRGLVIVPLAANAFSRTGLLRGAYQMGVPTLLTWGLLSLLLLPFTNLNLSDFELSHANGMVDFATSADAYSLLLLGAFLGAQANVRWGWDFGGILVPGLLALCWSHPSLLLATFGEAIVIGLVLRGILGLPRLRDTNWSGGRLLVLGFLVAYGLKFTLAVAAPGLWPGLSVRQLFGFGYLLPALMALRMVRSGHPFRTLVPAAITSFVGFAGAAGLVFVLGAPTQAGTDQQDQWLDLGHVQWHDLPNGGRYWIRRDGDGLVVSTGGSDRILRDATLGVAKLLDARAVVTCSRDPACANYVPGGTADGVLIVGTSSQQVLALPPSAPPGVRIGLLGTALGDMSLGRSDQDAHLGLSSSGKWRAVGLGIGRDADESLVPDTLRARLRVGKLRDEAEVSSAVPLLAAALSYWLSGDEGHEHALRAAAGMAHQLGLVLGQRADRCTLAGPDWAFYLDRSGDDVIIDVPAAGREAHVLPVAMALSEALRAKILIVDGGTPNSADRALVRDLGADLARTLGSQARGITLRGADVVDTNTRVPTVLAWSGRLNMGRPKQASWTHAISERVARAVGSSALPYEGAMRHLAFRYGRTRLQGVVEGRGGVGSHATLTLDRATASAFTRGAAHQQLARQSVLWESVVIDVEALAREPATGPLADLLAELAVETDDGRARELRRDAARAGAELMQLCDVVYGCVWAMARQCDGGGCLGTVTSRVQLSEVEDSRPETWQIELPQ